MRSPDYSLPQNKISTFAPMNETWTFEPAKSNRIERQPEGIAHSRDEEVHTYARGAADRRCPR
jgi:hypothetical protein